MRWLEKHLEKKAEPELWQFAYEAFSQTPITDDQAETIATACQSPAQLALMGKLLGESLIEKEPPSERVRLLLSIVDESVASLAEWIAALEGFYAWLKEEGRSTGFGLALGYIHCSSDAIAGGAPFSNLSQATDEMLGLYGFDGDSDAKNPPE